MRDAGDESVHLWTSCTNGVSAGRLPRRRIRSFAVAVACIFTVALEESLQRRNRRLVMVWWYGIACGRLTIVGNTGGRSRDLLRQVSSNSHSDGLRTGADPRPAQSGCRRWWRFGAEQVGRNKFAHGRVTGRRFERPLRTTANDGAIVHEDVCKIASGVRIAGLDTVHAGARFRPWRRLWLLMTVC